MVFPELPKSSCAIKMFYDPKVAQNITCSSVLMIIIYLLFYLIPNRLIEILYLFWWIRELRSLLAYPKLRNNVGLVHYYTLYLHVPALYQVLPMPYISSFLMGYLPNSGLQNSILHPGFLTFSHFLLTSLLSFSPSFLPLSLPLSLPSFLLSFLPSFPPSFFLPPPSFPSFLSSFSSSSFLPFYQVNM